MEVGAYILHLLTPCPLPPFCIVGYTSQLAAIAVLSRAEVRGTELFTNSSRVSASRVNYNLQQTVKQQLHDAFWWQRFYAVVKIFFKKKKKSK